MKRIVENKKIKESTKEIILDLCEKIVNKIGEDKIDKIILYGSYARGDYDDDSDINLLFILNEENLKDKNLRELRMDIINFSYDYEYNNDFTFIISPIIKEKRDYIENKNKKPLFINIEKEGNLVYEFNEP